MRQPNSIALGFTIIFCSPKLYCLLCIKYITPVLASYNHMTAIVWTKRICCSIYKKYRGGMFCIEGIGGILRHGRNYGSYSSNFIAKFTSKSKTHEAAIGQTCGIHSSGVNRVLVLKNSN